MHLISKMIITTDIRTMPCVTAATGIRNGPWATERGTKVWGETISIDTVPVIIVITRWKSGCSRLLINSYEERSELMTKWKEMTFVQSTWAFPLRDSRDFSSQIVKQCGLLCIQRIISYVWGWQRYCSLVYEI